MIDSILALGLMVGIVTVIGLIALGGFCLVLFSIILEDIIRCMWFGGNGELGSDWRKKRREERAAKKANK